MFLDSDIVNNIPVLLLVQVLTVSYPLDFSFCSSIFIESFTEFLEYKVELHLRIIPLIEAEQLQLLIYVDKGCISLSSCAKTFTVLKVLNIINAQKNKQIKLSRLCNFTTSPPSIQ